MSTSTVDGRPVRIALHRPWWRRWHAAWLEWRARSRRSDPWRELQHLDAATLKDLGAPAEMYCESLRARREALRSPVQTL